MESRMRGNPHVWLGGGDGETCGRKAARRPIPIQATLNERFIAVKHFADYDAFIDPEDLLNRAANIA
jgi:hypothetical protein